MGYILHTFIGEKDDLKPLTDNYRNAFCIPVGHEINIVPMTEDLYDEINQMNVSEDIGTFTYLTTNVETQILSLIGSRNIGYIEAEYHGGQGGQTAIAWKNGQRVSLIEYGQSAINSVLKHLGVIRDKGRDEFDTINLGRNRETSDWLSS